MKQSLTATYDNRTINLLNISEVELYQYSGPLVAIRIHKIKYTAEKVDNYDEPKIIEFKEYFGSNSRFKTREEATVHYVKLKNQIVQDWEQALLQTIKD
jgi:hypothetical protein